MNNVTRPGWHRVLNYICITLIVIVVLIMAFGIIKWPDAPIRQTPAGGFVGKTGVAHTSEDYELFNLWLKSLLVSFPLAFAVNFIAVIAKRKRKKESIKA